MTKEKNKKEQLDSVKEEVKKPGRKKKTEEDNYLDKQAKIGGDTIAKFVDKKIIEELTSIAKTEETENKIEESKTWAQKIKEEEQHILAKFIEKGKESKLEATNLKSQFDLPEIIKSDWVDLSGKDKSIVDSSNKEIEKTIKDAKPQPLSATAKKWLDYLNYTSVTPEKFILKYPNHKFITFIEEIIAYQKNSKQE